MTTIHGILECPLLDHGSKSEGRRAILTDNDGKKYGNYIRQYPKIRANKNASFSVVY